MLIWTDVAYMDGCPSNRVDSIRYGRRLYGSRLYGRITVSGITSDLTLIYVNFGIYGLFPLIYGIPLIFPLYFRIIRLGRKSDLFLYNYVGSEIRISGIPRKT